MLLILYRILVLAVHQLLVYQRLFRRRTESTLFIDSWKGNPLYEFQQRRVGFLCVTRYLVALKRDVSISHYLLPREDRVMASYSMASFGIRVRRVTTLRYIARDHGLVAPPHELGSPSSIRGPMRMNLPVVVHYL